MSRILCAESDQPSGHEPTGRRRIYACPRCYRVNPIKPSGVWAKHYGRDRREEDAETIPAPAPDPYEFDPDLRTGEPGEPAPFDAPQWLGVDDPDASPVYRDIEGPYSTVTYPGITAAYAREGRNRMTTSPCAHPDAPGPHSPAMLADDIAAILNAAGYRITRQHTDDATHPNDPENAAATLTASYDPRGASLQITIDLTDDDDR